MSMHNKPLTTIEEAGLILHGMGREIGKPSMSADILRHGIEFGQMTHADQIQCIQDQLDHEMPFDAKLRGRLMELLAKLKQEQVQYVDKLAEAINRINDLLLDDDGQAYKEVRKFIESLKP